MPAGPTTSPSGPSPCRRPRSALAAIRGNAAILRHADGRTHDEVLDYLRTVGRFSEAAAAKRLAFIEHPLWRTYVFVYAEGEALLRRWVEAVPDRGSDRNGSDACCTSS